MIFIIILIAVTLIIETFICSLNFPFTEKETPRDEMLKTEEQAGVLMVETENVKHEPYKTTDEIKVSVARQ